MNIVVVFLLLLVKHLDLCHDVAHDRGDNNLANHEQARAHEDLIKSLRSDVVAHEEQHDIIVKSDIFLKWCQMVKVCFGIIQMHWWHPIVKVELRTPVAILIDIIGLIICILFIDLL